MTIEPPRLDPAVAADGTRPADPVRVAVLALPSAANQYLFDAVAGSCQVVTVLTHAPQPKPTRTVRQKLERFGRAPLDHLARPGRRAVLRRLEARLDRDIRAALPQPRSAVFADVHRMTGADLNGEPGTALLRDLAPDLLVLSGAPLLKPHVYGIPRLGTVNLHWGIAPDYRGQQSIFTALRRRDYGAIGITMHLVDEGVDTGPVLAQGWPATEPGDTLADLWAATAQLGATMLSDLLEDLRRGPVTGERRPGPGIVVRSRDRRVWHHLAYGLDRAVLRRNPPRAEGRIVRYWAPALPVPRPPTG